MKTNSNIAQIKRPSSKNLLPIIVSVPHCGTLFPEELKHDFHAKYVQHPVDTDWFVHQLYDFVVDMGITLISANYSRYVIDLNRSSEQENLYQDQRRQTALCPSYTFAGDPLYVKDHKITQAEIDRRLQAYYWPYHHLLDQEMQAHLKNHGRVLLFDAHSIARCVPEIRKEPFPDVILGDNNGKTCAPELSEAAMRILTQSPLDNSYNDPFRGGQITRYWGRPQENRHALQLEMSQDLYLDPSTITFAPAKADRVRDTLQKLFESLYETLMRIKAVV